MDNGLLQRLSSPGVKRSVVLILIVMDNGLLLPVKGAKAAKKRS